MAGSSKVDVITVVNLQSQLMAMSFPQVRLGWVVALMLGGRG